MLQLHESMDAGICLKPQSRSYMMFLCISEFDSLVKYIYIYTVTHCLLLSKDGIMALIIKALALLANQKTKPASTVDTMCLDVQVSL